MSCRGYRWFTRRDARHARRFGRFRREHLRAQYCPSCRAWHLVPLPAAVIRGEVCA